MIRYCVTRHSLLSAPLDLPLFLVVLFLFSLWLYTMGTDSSLFFVEGIVVYRVKVVLLYISNAFFLSAVTAVVMFVASRQSS